MTAITTWIINVSTVFILAQLSKLGNAATVSTPTNTSLACYDCSETFKYVWDPYTQCQAYPTTNPLRECLGVERYCKVERTKYRSMTVSISRACTIDCYHGCYAYGFGLTKLKCTSCCQERACNVDNVAGNVHSNALTVVAAALAVMFSCYK